MKTRIKVSIIITVLVLLVSCSGADSAAPGGPGEPVSLNSTVLLDDFPQQVVPYGAGSALTLADLELEKQGDSLYGTVSYKQHEEEEFILVIHCTAPEQALIVYVDAEMRLTLALPQGAVLFTMNGYQVNGGESGTIEFSLQLRAPNAYSIQGAQGSVFVFAVPGTVNPHRILPESQQDTEAFQANSNVLEQDLEF
jgi:hypothetical protein